MEQKAGAQISARAFTQSLVILFLMMLIAGILTQVIPAGDFMRIQQQGRTVIDPQSFRFVERPNYPVWRWLIAPLEVLGGPDGLTIMIIIVFILMVGSAFAVLDASGILRGALARIVRMAGGRRYLLLLVITFLFMLMGAFLGIFEEVVPLVPVMIALAYVLGWDSLTGLGMSILATNMGFSAAITNPFTIGVAQKLAGLPAFSGAPFRILIFLVIYAVLAIFLVRYARKLDRNPQASPVYEQERAGRVKYQTSQLDTLAQADPRLGRAVGWFLAFVALIVVTLVVSPLVPALSDFALPIVGLLFLIGGIGAGLLAGAGAAAVWKAVREGVLGIAPAIPLILMASSVKFIIAQGGVLDTILHGASGAFTQTGPLVAALLIYTLPKSMIP
jgi:uncharacterized ion transporter superfamily protein YfcC